MNFYVERTSLSISQPPNRRTIHWLFFFALVISGLWLGYIGLKQYHQSSIIIEWSTASELETLGFNILRGENYDGPYERITLKFIPASIDPLRESDYTYKDTGVIPGKTYYYILEDINTEGNINRHGPLEISAERGGSYELLLSALLLSSAIIYSQITRTKKHLP
jgi:hypothetical protein